jgi:hypothetical protein
MLPRLLTALALITLSLPLFACHARPAVSAAVTTFTHVNVVDVNRGQILPDMTVVIEGRRSWPLRRPQRCASPARHASSMRLENI